MSNKIGKIEYFRGKAQLVKTIDITKLLNIPINLKIIMENPYVVSRIPIIKEIDGEVVWISQKEFILKLEPPNLDFNVYRKLAS